eukprot:2542236-Amphidinium_carterae.1
MSESHSVERSGAAVRGFAEAQHFTPPFCVALRPMLECLQLPSYLLCCCCCSSACGVHADSNLL